MTTRPNRRLAAGALLCAALLSACANDATSPTALQSPPDAAVARLVAMGFSRDQIVERGDLLVAEGDIVFRRADLAGPALNRLAVPGGPRAQYHATNLVQASVMAQGVHVNLSGIAANSGWLVAARSAMQAWNGTYGNTVKFIEVTTGGDVSVIFVSSISGGYSADAGYPVNGYPGGQVRISQAYSPTASQKITVVAHELGHIIGLRHTNWASAGDNEFPTGAVWIPGTPTGAESASVMTYATGFRNWAGFTSNDQKAVNYMYPAPMPVMTSGYDASSHPTFSWNAIANASQYRVTAQYLYYTWIYEPSFPEGGYWGQEWGASTVDYTTGTTLTDASRVRTYDDSCELFYYVEPIYPSGKFGQASLASQTFDAC